MKSLKLNAHQRIQLEFLLGAQRGAARDMFYLGAIIGKIRLDEKDRKVCNMRTVTQAGQDVATWDKLAALRRRRPPLISKTRKRGACCRRSKPGRGNSIRR